MLARQLSGEQPAHPAFADPDLDPLWNYPETLGWAHQYAQEEAKERVFARLLKQGQKVKAEEIPAATQLFTPAWIVRFLVENSLGRLWLQMHPDSALRASFTYLVPTADAEVGELPARVGEIRVLDPACGAMHFGLAAYDLLARCYAEELERAGSPGWPERPSVSTAAEIPAAIMAENLFGIDIDPEVLAVARRCLYLKAGVEPVHLYCLPPPLGALAPELEGVGPFHVILTNPPYMARKNAESVLANYLEQHFFEGKGDLYTAFLQRCLQWLVPGGRLAMITQSSFMFIGSYAGLRSHLLERAAIEVVAQFGVGAFAEIGGEKVNTAAFVMRREDDAQRRAVAVGSYLRLLDGGEEQKERALLAARDAGDYYRVAQIGHQLSAGAPWVYWMPAEVGSTYLGERVRDHAHFCRGITTADNGRFVRYWWEVGLAAIDWSCSSVDEAARSPKRWFPYMKGGGPIRWFGNHYYVLDWADGGRALRTSPQSAVRNLPFQFRTGVTYSSVTGGSLTARWMAEGFLFDQASNALFPHDPADLPLLLALLNHPVAGFTAGFNPTVNVVASDLNRIPWPRVDREAIAVDVSTCIDLARQVDEMSELSPYFRQPPMPGQADLAQLLGRMGQVEAAIADRIDEGLGLSAAGRAAIRERFRPVGPTLFTPVGLRDAWVSYAIGILLGRCRPGGYGGGPLLAARWAEIAPLVGDGPAADRAVDHQAVADLLEILLGVEAPPFELPAFIQRHHRTYKQHPVFQLEEGLVSMREPAL